VSRYQCILHKPTSRPVIIDRDNENSIICWLEETVDGEAVAEALNATIDLDSAKCVGKVVTTDTERDTEVSFVVLTCPYTNAPFMVMENFPSSVTYSPYFNGKPVLRGDYQSPGELV
jgi:hypothetical protein